MRHLSHLPNYCSLGHPIETLLLDLGALNVEMETVVAVRECFECLVF